MFVIAGKPEADKTVKPQIAPSRLRCPPQ